MSLHSAGVYAAAAPPPPDAPATAARPPTEAYVTLLTNDSFLPGVEVLAYTLNKYTARDGRPFVVLVTPAVSAVTRAKLRRLASPARAVQVLDTPPIPNPRCLLANVGKEGGDGARPVPAAASAGAPPLSTEPAAAAAAAAPASVHVPSWVDTGYTKLGLWGLTQFSKVVYLDADMLVVGAGLEELWERPGAPCPAAAPDVFPPDRFNAGLLVVEPDAAVHAALLAAAPLLPSHDGGDTGFLNAFFPGWFAAPPPSRLPFRFNAQRTLHWFTAAAQPGYWAAVQPVVVIHYSSSPKPWEVRPPQGGSGGRGGGGSGGGGAGSPRLRLGDLELQWWRAYTEMSVGGAITLM
jgi:glycogenin glucosyltransferase